MDKQNKRCAVRGSGEARASKAVGDAMIPILQPNPAEVAEDEQPTQVSCVEQSVVQGVEPRVYRVCRSFFHRCVERSEELQRVTTTLSFGGMLS